MNLKESISSVQEDILPKYDPKGEVLYQKQSTLRSLVGVLGILLPLILWLLLYVHSGHSTPLDSISHYFFTRVGSIFVIIVSLLAIFLLVYKGYETVDFILSSLAGISALLLLYFPTSNIDCSFLLDCNTVITKIEDNTFRETFHFAMAGIFLGCLALISIFLFTKHTEDTKGLVMPKLKAENMTYIICGFIMLLAMLLILTNIFGLLSKEDFNNKNLTFWLEVLALEAFGVSWFKKGLDTAKSKS